jgi:RNA polymerase sigma factor (sigma-70 family)
MTLAAGELEDIWRRESPHVLGALARRYGDFERCEDAAQEALLAAATTWPVDGVPDNPRGWLIRTGSRRIIDGLRADRARSDRELRVVEADSAVVEHGVEDDLDRDDSLQLLLLCCHPSLPPASRIPLTLRAVGGLTTEQIAAAFLVPVPTMAQRISRAKATLRRAGATFRGVTAAELPERIDSVRRVLYLIFNEGYTSSGGDRLIDVSLTREAIRLTRDLHKRLPSDTETTGLLALMLLTAARSPARVDDHDDLVRLADQDRTLWDRSLIAEGVALVEQALPVGPVGPFQLQAAIAAVHDEVDDYDETDWVQIVELYRMLDRIAPTPTVTLNRAVAVAMADGPVAGLAVVDELQSERSMQHNHRFHAVRAHLLELAGSTELARDAYGEAARLTTSIPEQRYLQAQVLRLR